MKQVSGSAAATARRRRATIIALPATARGQRTRQRLIDAAEHVFGELGFHNAGIVEITQRAEVALGTFYLYFPDKKAIFDDLVRTLNARLRRTISERVRDIDDRLEQEVVGFETFFEFVRKHRNLYRVILQAETVDEKIYRWHYQTLADGYVRGLKRAQAAGQVRTDLDPETLAYSLMGMAESLGSRYVLWDGRLPPLAARRTIRRFLEGGLRSQRKSRR
ncbi:MAG TPA: TetR/AcrR family transcriptional regulator [Candidatus Limnocylindria bacterium]|jgi:AcrR family transcriptional regulator|nr:TetR/AcrR family transcriptional regulator [Candidatus Limnocylindria bacterium]